MTDSLFQSMTQENAYDGQVAKLVKLSNKAGISITLMDIGATWLSCIIPIADEQREVLLGVATMADFKKHVTYLGATVGRYANRIAQGQFEIDGQQFQTETNHAGNTLHGGLNGFDKRRWNIDNASENSVQFSLVSPDGDQGFPGKLAVSVCYHLTELNQVKICYKATTDKATPVNLTNHAYFNLLGAESSADCKNHLLCINAQYYLPSNDLGIPLGELAPVENSSFDFRQPKTIDQDLLSDNQQKRVKGYDHSYLLDEKAQQGKCAAEVSSADNQLILRVFTDKPALHLYSGNWLSGTPNRIFKEDEIGGKSKEYADYAGLALETQFLPDSPNHPEWQQSCPILQIGQEYNYQTIYQFIVND
jgi:aldose 1-epimerase